MDRITVTALAKQVRTEANAYRFMEQMRWSNGVVCPHCGSVAEHYFLTPKSGLTTGEGDAARKTRLGYATARRVWKCKDCRKHFSVTTGTVMHGSKVSLRIWLFVTFEMSANKNGIAAREIERKYGVASRTAWFITQRLREAMKRNGAPLFSGTVVADETWIGGDPKNMHKDEVRRDGDGWMVSRTQKTPVVSLINKETGEVRSQVVPRVNGANLRAVMNEQVDTYNSVLHTDGAQVYKGFRGYFMAHHSVDHAAGEYVRGEVSTNMAENYFSQLKRSIDGTHHHVSIEHLPRYLAEFDFRYTFCQDTDSMRMHRLMGRVGGRRLSYKAI